MDFGTFSLITGVATLLGFMLQVRDIFPEHRESRKNLLILISGIFIGTVLGGLQNITVQYNVPLTGHTLLVGFISIVLGVLVIVGALSTESTKRDDLFSITGVGVFVLMLILMFGGSTGSTGERSNRILTADELMMLVDINTEKGNIDRSIFLLQQIKAKLKNDDPRNAVLNNKIILLKNKQVGTTE